MTFNARLHIRIHCLGPAAIFSADNMTLDPWGVRDSLDVEDGGVERENMLNIARLVYITVDVAPRNAETLSVNCYRRLCAHPSGYHDTAIIAVLLTQKRKRKAR